MLGGRSGLVGFHPDSLLQRKTAPPLYFTGFEILNQAVLIGDGDNQLAAPMYQTELIAVDYNRKVLSFQFAALDFIHPEKQVYRFRLTPFHQEWQYNGNKREITFTNLDPGTYRLQVETSENGYDWTGKFLILRVRPPWYRTWWAYLLYVLSIGSALYAIRGYELKRQLAKSEAHRLQELDNVKTRLYTNITHEFGYPTSGRHRYRPDARQRIDASARRPDRLGKPPRRRRDLYGDITRHARGRAAAVSAGKLFY